MILFLPPGSLFREAEPTNVPDQDFGELPAVAPPLGNGLASTNACSARQPH